MEYLLKKYKVVIKRNYSIFESLIVVFLMIIGAALAIKSIFFTILVFFLVIIGLIAKNTISCNNKSRKIKLTKFDNFDKLKKIAKYDNFEEFKKEIDQEIKAENVVKIEDTYISPFYFYLTANWFILLYRSNPLIIRKDKIISCSKEFVPSKGNEVIKLNIVGVKGYEICDCPDDDIAAKIVKLTNEYAINHKQWKKMQKRGNS